MTGIIDVGGGMRDIYGAGVLDYCLDNNINFDLCIGVSAGSANLASFLAKQRGRTYKFYAEYPQRWQYMSFKNMALTGSFFNLEYIYTTLSNEGGEYPIDFNAFETSESDYLAVATNAKTGKTEFLPKNAITKNDLWAIKASCAMPVACKPYRHGDSEYFDGGISDPLPVKKALEMGCDKVYVIVPRPLLKKQREFSTLMQPFLKKYPNVLNLMKNRPKIYNDEIDEIEEYRKQGKVVIIAPASDKGLNMITKNSNKLDVHYQRGYNDAAKLIK